MPIITVEQYKQIRNKTGYKDDAWIQTLIPLVEDEYLRIRNAPLEPEGVFPKGAVLVAADMIDFRMTELQKRGITSETIGDYSVSYDSDTEAEYPSFIRKRIRRHARLR